MATAAYPNCDFALLDTTFFRICLDASKGVLNLVVVKGGQSKGAQQLAPYFMHKASYRSQVSKTLPQVQKAVGFHIQGLAQIPAANYLAQTQAKFAGVVAKVPAFMNIMRRLLVDGEASLRDTFLSAKAAQPQGTRMCV